MSDVSLKISQPKYKMATLTHSNYLQDEQYYVYRLHNAWYIDYRTFMHYCTIVYIISLLNKKNCFFLYFDINSENVRNCLVEL